MLRFFLNMHIYTFILYFDNIFKESYILNILQCTKAIGKAFRHEQIECHINLMHWQIMQKRQMILLLDIFAVCVRTGHKKEYSNNFYHPLTAKQSMFMPAKP